MDKGGKRKSRNKRERERLSKLRKSEKDKKMEKRTIVYAEEPKEWRGKQAIGII